MRFYLFLQAFSLILCCFSFFSCKKALVVNDVWETESIRSRMNKLLEYAVWTDEIEPERLSVPLSDGVKKSPLAAAASTSVNSVPVYPSIDGFGSLDTTELPLELRNLVFSFCSALFSVNGVDSLMQKENLFLLALFYSDIYRMIPSLASDKDKNVDVESVLIGQPFFKGGEYDVPVRICLKSTQLDVHVFGAFLQNKWAITQIQLSKWGAR